MKVYTLLCFLFLLVAVVCCKKPYTPDAVTAPNNYLVVEGVINAGADSTVIKLSRTVNLSSGVVNNAETKATVVIESDQNLKIALTEMTGGKYVSGALNLNVSSKYRLRIKTSNNKEYLSDFVEVKITPPIDSVGFTPGANGIQVYANTHDPANGTHYYRWDYDETWQFHAKYQSDYISNGTEIVRRTTDQMIYTCFGNAVSSSIVLGSSAKLSSDVIFQAPITTVAATSEKIEARYSILLRQYALTTEGYNFWVNLKKNTEQLGSIFDAQPSNINGNIHNTADATEPVIGFISATTVQTKRIFIDKAQLPLGWKETYPYSCTADSVPLMVVTRTGTTYPVRESLVPLPNLSVPLRQYALDGAVTPTGYLATSNECADCTLRGTKKQPSFWK